MLRDRGMDMYQSRHHCHVVRRKVWQEIQEVKVEKYCGQGVTGCRHLEEANYQDYVGGVYDMKFDKYGKIVWSLKSSAVERQNSLSPDTMQRLEDCGIETNAVKTFVGMVSEKRANEALEIIENLSRSLK